MSSSVAPLFPKTSVFIPAYWATARSEILTQEEADTRYLRFPVGQGTESIPNLIVAGTSTLGITSTSQITNTGNITSTDYISSNTEIFCLDPTTGNNIDIFPSHINGSVAGGNAMNLSMNDGFNFYNSTQERAILTDPANGTTQWSNSISNSPTYPFLIIGIEIPNPQTTAVIKLENDVSTPTTLLIQSFNADDQNAQISVISGDDLGTSPQILLEALDNILGQQSSIYIQGSSILFNSPSQLLSIGELADLPTAFFSSFIKFDTQKGMLEKSLIDTTTTGTTTLFFPDDVCRTRINTPTLPGRIYVLPAFNSSPSTSGMWYGFCNKSTTQTIAICFPTSATTIFTIPVAPAGGVGSFVKFAVDNANTAYYRCG